MLQNPQEDGKQETLQTMLQVRLHSSTEGMLHRAANPRKRYAMIWVLYSNWYQNRHSTGDSCTLIKPHRFGCFRVFFWWNWQFSRTPHVPGVEGRLGGIRFRDENCHLARAQNDSCCAQIELSKCVLDAYEYLQHQGYLCPTCAAPSRTVSNLADVPRWSPIARLNCHARPCGF